MPLYPPISFYLYIPKVNLGSFYFPPLEEVSNSLDQSDPTSQALLSQHSKMLEIIELEAIKLTGNLETTEAQVLRFRNDSGIAYSFSQAQSAFGDVANLQIDYNHLLQNWWNRPRWTPKGRITYAEDASLGLGSNTVQPLMGALVKVRKWGFLVIKKDHTDRNGRYETTSTRTRRVKYAVHFRNDNYEFRVCSESGYVPAKYRDNRRYDRQGFNAHFSSGSRSHFHAMVCNASFDYYDRIVNQFGIASPQRSGVASAINGGLKIVAKYRRDISSQFTGEIPFVPYIRISKHRHGYRGSDGVYASTVHELTHAGHYQMDTGFFINFQGNRKHRLVMRESWAEGVETVLTNERYSKFNPVYSSFPYGDAGLNSRYQEASVAGMTKYSPLVIDLVDFHNQNSANAVRPLDRIGGHTLKDIEYALNNSRNLWNWRNKLHDNTPSNLSNQYIDDVFDYALTVANRL